jgi:energy-coupling factor transport system permease protein
MLVTWRYRERRSLVQSFDPRAWFIFYASFLASSLLFWDLRFLVPLFTIALVAVLTSGVTWRETYRTWLFIGGFVTFFSLLTFLTGRGGMEHYAEEHTITTFRTPFAILGWQPELPITVERVVYAASQLVRVASVSAMTVLIPYTLNPEHYGITFRGLGLPDKIAYAMELTMRFIPTFARDFRLTIDAQRARGYEIEKLRGGLFAQVRKLAPLIVPVTIHALAGSEDIIDAMDLRAFGIGPRTWLVQLVYRRRDYVLIVAAVVLFVASLVFSALGYAQLWIPDWALAWAG